MLGTKRELKHARQFREVRAIVTSKTPTGGGEEERGNGSGTGGEGEGGHDRCELCEARGKRG